MTWSHPRGYDPLIAASAEWKARSGVEVEWDKRSLQDFESVSVRELAARYDLIVIDHPHVGQITAENCLTPLDVAGRETAREELEQGSVGPSWRSYAWAGRQWALPIDAATQVQAWRPDLIDAPAIAWGDMLELARKGLVNCPLRPPHSLMTIMTLAANLGRPGNVGGPELFDRETGARAVEMMRELIALIDPACYEMDPIDVLEELAGSDARKACAPLIYGYVSYALKGFRPARIRFANVPVAGANGPVGSTLGGTGIAVSALCAERAAAIDFAYWLASAPVQRGLYAASGGQPAHSDAWRDPATNGPTGNFYLDTRATLDGAWVRPRHNGYMRFQHAAAVRLNEGFKNRDSAALIVEALNALFRASLTDGAAAKAGAPNAP
jgi:multiple sugar transport system substrate-binding protein